MRIRDFIFNATMIVAMTMTVGAGIEGCHASSSTTPPAALAPGYNSAADQNLGRDLAAVDAFVMQEKVNYASASATQQAAEKQYLNSFIDAATVANAVYVSYHNGTATLGDAQAALTQAQTAESTLATNLGVK